MQEKQYSSTWQALTILQCTCHSRNSEENTIDVLNWELSSVRAAVANRLQVWFISPQSGNRSGLGGK